MYRVVHIIAAAARGVNAGRARRTGTGGTNKRPTTGHSSRVAPLIGKHKRKEELPQPPQDDPKTGYWWCFGEGAPPGAEEAHRRKADKKREEQARRRSEGYEWLFR